MIVEHECNGCFRKMLSDTDASKQPTGEITVTVEAYCSECCEESPINEIIRTCVLELYADNVRGIA